MKRTIIVMMISCLLFGQVDYSTEIQEDIFDIRCTNCHVYGHNSGLNLTSYLVLQVLLLNRETMLTAIYGKECIMVKCHLGIIPILALMR